MADLRDAQGIREDHRAIIARLNEVEECATVHTLLREFMSKICRLESMFTGEDGGAIFEAIRACNRRIDSQKITLDDFYARIRTQDWYHDISDQEEDEEVENQPGIENRSSGRRRLRGHAPHRRASRQWTRPMPRPPPPENDTLLPQTTDRTPENSTEMMQQAMQRLLAAYNQCTHRVAQTDDRMEQFRSNLRRDALELALNVQRLEQDLQYQFQATARLKDSLHDDVQERVKGLEEKLRFMIDHEAHVNQTIDRNAHSQCASIKAIIAEQAELRRIVEDLASRLDRSQEMSGTAQNEVSTNALLEINALKSKVSRLTEQNTKLEGDVSYLSSLSEHVDALWKCLPPGSKPPGETGEEGQERVATAVEVQDEMDEFRRDVYRKIKELATGLNNLRESVQLIERDKAEAISHKVSTLVENSVGSLTERLTELEHTVQSQGTTPVTEEDVLDMETWSTLEQVIWSELGKLKEQSQEIPNLYTICGEHHTNQKSQEKQISGLRTFARRVEQFLTQLRSGAVAPREPMDTQDKEGESSESLGYVPGAPASSTNVPASLRQPRHHLGHQFHDSPTGRSRCSKEIARASK